MKKIAAFLIPAVLIIAGSVGMVASSSASDSSIMPVMAPLVETEYSQEDYNLAYSKAGEFKYANAAVKDLSDALDKQLDGWKYWKYLPYTIDQLDGSTYEVKMYAWDADQTTTMYEVDSDSSATGGNIFNTLVKYVQNSTYQLESCQGIASRGNYSYDAFSRLTQCVKEKNSIYGNVVAVVNDAEKVMNYGSIVARSNLMALYPNDNISSLTGDQLISVIEASPYYAKFGDYHISGGLADSWERIAWGSERNIFADDFNVDAVAYDGTSSSYQHHFAIVYARAKAINPDFTFDLTAYGEKSSSGDNTGGNTGTGDNTGDNTGGSTDPTTPTNPTDPTDPTTPDTPDTPTDSDSTQPSEPASSTNTANNSISTTSSTSSAKFTAPNTGSLGQSNSSANAVFALSAVATLAGLIGAIVMIRSYFFSPLKRK